ncbi:phosphoenolpyruvate mutase [Anaerosporobacter mobilis DSM 15930]|jgi:phosphoenolpyruvate phosphomutase|uniref:phosphoenolpyruvate mutase n=1 Tax=Anaerosporobacter mobilis DSM 15930 TaxID=1120996 RepID=A0A1M7KD50_9FIRM|nr:phosphoenolpyruvate mutase [Anaerosporobacter mobilis]SHM63225.1 phosphoenolpyruvate mutase [Anaerosporobacter mobilis DSM 15930]
MKCNLPELRRGKLKSLLNENKYIRVMEASNGLSGLIVERANRNGKEYDAMWVSSLCDSVLKGKPDNEVVDFSSRVKTIEEILEVTSKPIIVDGDTGGQVEHFVHHVRTLERMGVSAIIIEDKKGLKQNSLFGNGTEQILEDKLTFANKITRGKEALQTEEFLIFARIESFIADKSVEEALDRAETYVDAGADGIMIHSYKSDGEEITSFLTRFKKDYPDVIVIVIPTTYSKFTETQLSDLGANVIIYANHLLRSAYPAMLRTAEKILEDECCEEASNEYCLSMEEILQVIRG